MTEMRYAVMAASTASRTVELFVDEQEAVRTANDYSCAGFSVSVFGLEDDSGEGRAVYLEVYAM